jgi:ABC-type transporter Mla MlaB component
MAMTTVGQPTQSLEILVTPRGSGGVEVAVNGELDALSIDALAARIGELLRTVPDGRVDRDGQSVPAVIELDLAGVAFIDAAAVGRLRQLHRLTADAGCVLSITAATQFAWWLLSCTGLASIFPVPAKHRWASEPGS